MGIGKAQRFVLTSEDRELARRKAESAVDLYLRLRKKKGLSVNLYQRGFHTRGYYVGYCAELAIARFYKVPIR